MKNICYLIELNKSMVENPVFCTYKLDCIYKEPQYVLVSHDFKTNSSVSGAEFPSSICINQCIHYTKVDIPKIIREKKEDGS